METYKFDGTEYTQKPLNTGAFDNALSILDDVGLDDVIKAWNEIHETFQSNKGKTVEVDMGDVAESIIKMLAAIGRANATSKLMESLLTLSPEEAELVPMAVARSAIIDFFTLNQEWLPISPLFGRAMKLLKKERGRNYKKSSEKLGMRIKQALSWVNMRKPLMA